MFLGQGTLSFLITRTQTRRVVSPSMSMIYDENDCSRPPTCAAVGGPWSMSSTWFIGIALAWSIHTLPALSPSLSLFLALYLALSLLLSLHIIYMYIYMCVVFDFKNMYWVSCVDMLLSWVYVCVAMLHCLSCLECWLRVSPSDRLFCVWIVPCVCGMVCCVVFVFH